MPLMPSDLRVRLDFDARCKSRLLLTLENGERAALVVARGGVLRAGDIVRLEDGRDVQIIAADEPLLEARACIGESPYRHDHRADPGSDAKDLAHEAAHEGEQGGDGKHAQHDDVHPRH